MSKILMADDDELTVGIYRKKLEQEGFEVDTVGDGLAAVTYLRKSKPDLLILDLMLPKFNGFEVLKYIRAEESLKSLRVLVLSNFYVVGTEHEVTASLADAILLKSGCRPATLIENVNQLLSFGAAARSKDAVPALDNSVAPPKEADTGTVEKSYLDFLKNAPAILATLRQMNEAFVKCDKPELRELRLFDFYRKVHALTAIAGLTGCETIAMLSSAFEALLFHLHENPGLITASTLQTIAFTLDVLGLAFAAAGAGQPIPTTQSRVLIVDDDPVAARLLVSALGAAKLTAASVHDPQTALRALERSQFDLLLFDVQMPQMDGFELCKKVRALPQYRKTPIIFVTGHADFDNRIHSVLSGGNDLISKPIFPTELAVKAINHMLRSKLPPPWGMG